MLRLPVRGLTCLALALSMALLTGCGGSTDGTVAVTGRVHKAGEPLMVQGADVGLGMVRLEFYEIIEDGKISTDAHTAVAQADGSFDLGTPGLAPGKYRVCVYQWDPYPQVDRLGGKFDARNSKITVDIQDGVTLDIDVSKPDGGHSPQ